ncbi:MAG TPA: NUDIX hydrolase [Candidatus Levybacteria bacterium]|nr:NUDIX hydrolase [Candidatus Levybacteria bacterium]
METITDQVNIILTYKGKVLVMHTENNPLLLNEVVWRFIGRNREKGKSMEETILREVEKQTGIKLSHIEFLSTIQEDTIQKHFYHGRLTDTNVNNMNRDRGQTIQFYSMRELEKIPLSSSTKKFISQHHDIFERTQSAQ